MTIINRIKFPKIVLKRETKKDGIKYITNHIPISIVNNPINIVLFSSFIRPFIFFDIFIINNYIILYLFISIYLPVDPNPPVPRSVSSPSSCLVPTTSTKIGTKPGAQICTYLSNFLPKKSASISSL